MYDEFSTVLLTTPWNQDHSDLVAEFLVTPRGLHALNHRQGVVSELPEQRLFLSLTHDGYLQTTV